MSFDPYYEWLHLPPGPRPPSPETLLGLQAGEANRDLILAAAMKCAGIVRGYGLSKHSEVAAELLREIAQAVQTLEMKSAEHAATQGHAPRPAPADRPTLPVVQGKPIDLAGATTGPLARGDTLRRDGPSAQPQRQTVGPRDRVPATQITPAVGPAPVRSVQDILTLLGGAVLVEPAKPIPSMFDERQRQREHQQRRDRGEESRKVLNTVVAICGSGIALLLMVVLLRALMSGKEPSIQVATVQPKTTFAAGGGEERGSEVAPASAADLADKPKGSNPREPSAAPESPEAGMDRQSPAASPPSASNRPETSAADHQGATPAEPATKEPSESAAARPDQTPPAPELAESVLAELYPAVDLPAIGDSAVSRARARPVSLGVVEHEAARLLEFTVVGSQCALQDTSLAGVPFTVERRRLSGNSHGADGEGLSWAVSLRGNARQYVRFPDQPLKDNSRPERDVFLPFDRRVATIWWEDKELRFDWDAAQEPFILQWGTKDRTMNGSHGIEDSLRLCQLHVHAGPHSRAIALLRAQRLLPLRINPAKGQTSQSLGVITAPRVPAGTPTVVQFSKVTGVKLEHSIGDDNTLTFRQLTSDKIQNDLPLQATFSLRAERSKTGVLSVACQPLAPASKEYQNVQEKRKRNVIERQYLRFAATVQAQAEIHYRVFLDLPTHVVELGTTEGVP